MLMAPALILITAMLGATTTPSASPISSPLPTKSQVELYQASSPDDVETQKVPVNLARGYLGARVAVVGRPASEQAQASGLIADDVSYHYKLPAGKTTLIISLTQNIALNRFCFLISGTDGVVQVSGATMQLDANSSWWQQLGSNTTFQPDIQCAVEWPWSDVRYLRVQFDLKNEGYVSPVGIFGTPTVKDVHVVSSRAPGLGTQRNTGQQNANSFSSMDNTDNVTDQINVASLPSHGRVSYVSSGMERPQSSAVMLDNDLGSSYAFDDQDPNPTFIVEMSEQHPICRIATYYQSASPGAWEIYPLQGIPGSETQPATTPKPSTALFPAATPQGLGGVLTSLLWSQAPLKAIKMPPGFFDQNKPSFTLSNNNNKDPFGVVEFKPQPCRYVLLRWVTSQTGAPSGMKVYQVSIFTDPKDERLAALPTVNFASIGPDLGGAKGSPGPGGTPGGPPPIPVDPPRPPTPTPTPVSP